MAETFRTSEIAALIGVHPNTVRLYEELELIPKPERLPNGYRVFTDRKSTRQNSSHIRRSRMPSSA